MGKSNNLEIKKENKINLSSFLEKFGLQNKNIEITENSGMYPHKEKIEENWSYYTGCGFNRLKEIFSEEKKEISTIAIVGIGSGVEGILATEIFKPELKNLIITDIDSEIIDEATKNIKSVSEKNEVIVTPLVGSYCEPIEKNGTKIDLIYGNIPNLPSSSEIDLSQGAEKGTFVPSSLYEGYKPPQKFINWAMGSQFAFLQSAKKVLSKDGSIVTALGGRMPLSLVKELFENSELKLEEIMVGFKEQTEALIDFKGYHRLESKYGVSFEYYLFQEVMKTMKEKNIENPSNKISGEELKRILEPFKISSGKALELYKNGISIGHTVHLFRGKN